MGCHREDWLGWVQFLFAHLNSSSKKEEEKLKSELNMNGVSFLRVVHSQKKSTFLNYFVFSALMMGFHPYVYVDVHVKSVPSFRFLF